MEKDIGKIKKNETTDVIIRIDDFGGKVGLTIREFTTSDRYTGFTKSGTRIAAESFKDFKDIINSINEDDLKVDESAKPEESKEAGKEDKEQKTLEDPGEKSEERVEKELNN